WAEVTLADRHPTARGEERSATRARASPARDDPRRPLHSTFSSRARSTGQSLSVPSRVNTQTPSRIFAADPEGTGTLGWDRHDPPSIQALCGTGDAATQSWVLCCDCSTPGSQG